MKRGWGLVWLGCAFATSCGDPDGNSICANEESPCGTGGAERCSLDFSYIEVCQENDRGCLAWTAGTVCPVHQRCSGSRTNRECSCHHQCDSDQPLLCQENVVAACRSDEAGCWYADPQQDCALQEQFCDDQEGEARCVTCLDHGCPAQGHRRCQGNMVQSCRTNPQGCRAWVDELDCTTLEPTQGCRVSGPTQAECTEACLSECAEGDQRCQDDVAEQCALSSTGCWRWEERLNCRTEGDPPPQRCALWEGTARCEDYSPASCPLPLEVPGLPYELSGLDFALDYEDDHRFAGTGCAAQDQAPEAVLLVPLAANQGVWVRETGAADVVLSIQSECGNEFNCLLSDDGDRTGLRYLAPTAGAVYVVVEQRQADGGQDYGILLEGFEPETCDTNQDEDLDGLSDCDDSDCFGLPACAAAEVNCTDGGDNDGDGATDCDDSDCQGPPDCQLRAGLVQSLAATDLALTGCAVTFTPAASPAGFTWDSDCTCTGVWAVTPGSGDDEGGSSVHYALDDRTSREHTFELLVSGFDFFGRNYGAISIGANGFITLGDSDHSASRSVEEFFEYPRIAALDLELDPAASAAAEIWVDEWTDQVAVSYVAVPLAGGEQEVSFQTILRDTGVVEFHYLQAEPLEAGYLGLAEGDQGSVSPPTSRVVDRPLGPREPGDLIISEIHWDPSGDQDSQREYLELANLRGQELSLECCLLNEQPLESAVVPAGGQLALAGSQDSDANGAIEGAALLPRSAPWSDSTAQPLRLTCQGVTIDELAWTTDQPWPAGSTGIAMQLSSWGYTAQDNDRPGRWCDANARYPDPAGDSGDYGSPGQPNHPCGETVVLEDDLEDDPGGTPRWQVGGEWAWGSPGATDGPESCAGGHGCFGTNLTGHYSSSLDDEANALRLGPFDLSDLEEARLHFDLWLSCEACCDGGRLEVSTSPTGPFTPLTEVYPPYGTGDRWRGELAPQWRPAWVSLADQAGQSQVYLRWVFSSNESNEGPGWYLDNLTVEGQ